MKTYIVQMVDGSKESVVAFSVAVDGGDLILRDRAGAAVAAFAAGAWFSALPQDAAGAH